MIEKRQFYIGGTWVDPQDGRDHRVIDPSTEEACAVISLGGTADTDAAVAAAKAALPGWMATPPEERIALLETLVDLYKARAGDMAQAISMEMGAPIDMAKSSQWGAGYGHLKTFVKAARDFRFVRPLGDHAPTDRIIYEAVGVAALITPWNWPMNQITLKVGAAVVAGCTMVLKPSEESPLSAMIFAEMMHEAGFPAGVFNLINGDGAGVGTDLSGHADVDMVSFTGSTRAGTAISKNAAETLKKVHLELGGKGANLIFADADENAVKRGVLHMMNNTGQSCNAPSRMIVEASAYDAAVETAAEVANGVAVGPASEDGRHIGPVVNESQWNKIQDLIQTGIDEGARLVAGGTGRPEGLNRGLLRPPDGLRGRHERDDRRARGDLRPRPVDHALRDRRGRRRDGQRHGLRADRLRPEFRRRAAQPACAAAARGHGGDERREPRGGCALRRHEAVGQRARGRHLGHRGFHGSEGGLGLVERLIRDGA